MTIDNVEDIDAILRYDPMADEPSEKGASGGGEEQEVEAAEQDTDTTDEDEGTPSESESEPEKPSESREPAQGGEKELELANLREQVRQLNERLSQPTEQPTQSDQPSKTDDTDEVPSYQMGIPEQIVNLIASEEPAERQQGLQALVMGIGQTVHKTVMEQVKEKLEAAKNEVSQNVTGNVEQKTQAEQIRLDYFGKNPGHDSDLVRPIVSKHSTAVMRERQAKSWSPELREEIARRVNEELKQYGLGPDGKPIQKATPAPKPPKQQRQNSRPAPTAGTEVDDIERTLFG